MSIRFVLNGRSVEVTGAAPTTTLLRWLRDEAALTGTKEGCAEGDCGACAVALLEPGPQPAWRVVNSCLVLLPSLDGRTLVSVEGLARGDALHPAQQSMVDHLGSQCGFCTPGFVMALFEATYRDDLDAPWKLDDQLCGNLCRCTGYRPIRDALAEVAGTCPVDAFHQTTQAPAALPGPLDVTHDAQRYVRPTERAALWDALEAGGRPVAGATDLGLAITKQHRSFPLLVGLGALPELRRHERVDGGVFLGAGVPLSEVESRDLIPPVTRMLRFFGSRPIKNRATVGGNLCNASPIGDLPPILIALDAVAHIGGRDGDRTVALSEFFLDYRKTALRSGEILLGVEVPDPGPWLVGAYKVSKRRELDISTVAAGMAVRLDRRGHVEDIRLAYGGMAATPKRATHAEASLRRSPWTTPTIESAILALERDFRPIDDHRGSAWYRATLAANLLRGFHHETTQTTLALPDRPTGTVTLGDPA